MWDSTTQGALDDRCRRDPHRCQPATTAGGPEPVRHERAAARGRRMVGRRSDRVARQGSRRRARGRGGGPMGRRGPPVSAGAAHPRPVREPRRRGRLPPVVAPVHAPGRRTWCARDALGRAGTGRPRRAGRDAVDARAGRARALLPDLDDLRRRPGAAREPRTRRGVGAPHHRAGVRPGTAPAAGEGGRTRGHGDDREAGRLGRACEHDRRDPAGGRHVCRCAGTSGSARRR